MTILCDAAPKDVTGAALIETLKKRIGTAALAGALVPLAMAGVVSEAEAGTEFPRTSFVQGNVEAEGDQFRYSFEVFNETGFLGQEFEYPAPGDSVIVNWELPLFSLNGIDVNSITSPENWTFEVIDIVGNVVINGNGDTTGQSQIYNTDGPYGEYVWDWTKEDDPVFNDATANPDGQIYGPDPDIFLAPPLILHWFTLDREGPLDPILEGDSRGNIQDDRGTFSFLAADGATNAPYQASWLDQDPTIGDPPIPQGAAIGVPDNAQVPEPGTLALFGAGLLGLIGLRRRRKSI